MADQKKWRHNELASDLADHFRNDNARVVWEDMQLGPSGSPRPDVYVIPKTYSKFNPAAYEIKISRSDFLSDIKSGKWHSYYKYAKTVTFAVPDGLVVKNELPDGAGLIVRKDKIWRVTKRPTVQKLDTLPHTAWMKLFIDGIDRATEMQTKCFFEDSVKLKIIKKKLGDEISEMISLGQNLEYKIKSANEEKARQVDAIRKTIGRRSDFERKIRGQSLEQRNEICRIAGIAEGSSEWAIDTAIRNLKTDVNTDERVAQLLSVINRANREFKDARIFLETKGNE